MPPALLVLLLALVPGAETRAHRPQSLGSSYGRLFGEHSLGLEVSFLSTPDGAHVLREKPPELPKTTKTTCEVLGLVIVIGLLAGCVPGLPPHTRAVMLACVSIGSLAALIYVFLWDSGILVTWQSGGELGGWCTVVVLAAVLQLIHCCFGSCCFYLLASAVASDAIAQAEIDKVLDEERGERTEFAPFAGEGRTMDDLDSPGAGTGLDEPRPTPPA